MVADVDGDDGVGRQVLRQRGEDRGRRDAHDRGRRPPGAASPRATAPTARRHRRAGPTAFAASGGVVERRQRRARRRRGSAPSRRGSDRSDPGSSSIWTIGLYDAMPVWFENDAPTTTSRSDSFISQLATGVPLRPRTPAPSGWVSGTSPLALNVVSTGAPSRSASASSCVRPRRAPWPTTNTGRRGVAQQDRSRRRPPRRPARSAGVVNRPAGVAASASEGCSCTSSGSTRCATPRRSTACLTASAASSAWSLPDWTVVVETATSRNTADRSRSWNAPRPITFEGTWPEIAMHRGLVELRVVQAGEQVGRAGPGDREARGRTAGELAVGTGRERRRTLVPDADEPQLAALLGPAHRVGEAEVGVARPSRRRCRHRGRPGSRRARRTPTVGSALRGEADEDAVLALRPRRTPRLRR